MDIRHSRAAGLCQYGALAPLAGGSSVAEAIGVSRYKGNWLGGWSQTGTTPERHYMYMDPAPRGTVPGRLLAAWRWLLNGQHECLQMECVRVPGQRAVDDRMTPASPSEVGAAGGPARSDRGPLPGVSAVTQMLKEKNFSNRKLRHVIPLRLTHVSVVMANSPHPCGL